MQPLLTLSQTAEYLQLSLRQVRRLVDGGCMPVVRLGMRTPRVRMEDLVAYVNSTMIRYTDSCCDDGAFAGKGGRK